MDVLFLKKYLKAKKNITFPMQCLNASALDARKTLKGI